MKKLPKTFMPHISNYHIFIPQLLVTFIPAWSFGTLKDFVFSMKYTFISLKDYSQRPINLSSFICIICYILYIELLSCNL